jgi:hypothetical protein
MPGPSALIELRPVGAPRDIRRRSRGQAQSASRRSPVLASARVELREGSTAGLREFECYSAFCRHPLSGEPQARKREAATLCGCPEVGAARADRKSPRAAPNGRNGPSRHAAFGSNRTLRPVVAPRAKNAKIRPPVGITTKSNQVFAQPGPTAEIVCVAVSGNSERIPLTYGSAQSALIPK